jgi:hypothetical protein
MKICRLRNSLCQHDLERVQGDLLFKHIAVVQQKVRKEDSVHYPIRIIWMRPRQKNGIFSALFKEVEAMRHPRLDFKRPVLRGVDLLGYRVSLNECYLSLKDLKGLGLVEMEVERWSLTSSKLLSR